MKEQEQISELKFDVAAAIPIAGNSKRFTGSASVVVQEGYELIFLPGDRVTWDLDVRRITGGVEVSGKVSGPVTLECARCLEEFEYPVNLALKEHALWISEEEIEPGVDYAEEYLVLDGILDILPVLRDAICFSFPVKRVCSDECRGICPVCGVNLNLEQCGCSKQEVDERLKPLLELKRRMEEE